jgi:type III pantothenate kinase
MSALLIDIGNTRLKWALKTAAGLQPGPPIVHADADFLTQLAAAFRDIEAVDSIWCADVRRSQTGQLTAEWLTQRFATTVHTPTTPASGGGIQNAYAEPARLGIDRWLAMLGGFQAGRGLMVVDAGSALTLDAVDPSGRHCGGLIFPGAQMLRRALARDTELVQVAFAPSRPSGTTRLGSSTAQCVQFAIDAAAVALIDRAREDWRPLLGDKAVFALTGGDAPSLAPALSGNWANDPLLVLRGLARFIEQSA